MYLIIPLSSLLPPLMLLPVSDEEGDEAEDKGLVGGELQSDVVASESLRTIRPVSTRSASRASLSRSAANKSHEHI